MCTLIYKQYENNEKKCNDEIYQSLVEEGQTTQWLKRITKGQTTIYKHYT